MEELCIAKRGARHVSAPFFSAAQCGPLTNSHRPEPSTPGWYCKTFRRKHRGQMTCRWLVSLDVKPNAQVRKVGEITSQQNAPIKCRKQQKKKAVPCLCSEPPLSHPCRHASVRRSGQTVKESCSTHKPTEKIPVKGWGRTGGDILH